MQTEQRDRVSPSIQSPSGEEAHRRILPPQFFGDAEFGQELKGWHIGPADEMIETLNRNSTKVKMSCHSARFSVGFQNIHLVPVQHRLIGSSKPHGSGTYDYQS